MLALAVYDAGVCECGFHRTIANDPGTFYTVDVEDCPVCADIATFNRIQAATDEKALKALGKDPRPELPRPGDGRHSRVRLLDESEAEGMQPLTTQQPAQQPSQPERRPRGHQT